MESTIIVIDDVSPDGCAERAAKLLERHTNAETITLSQFLKSSGFSYDHRIGMLVRDPVAAAEFTARASETRLLNRVVEISNDTCNALLDPERPHGPDTLPARFVFAAYVSLFGAFKHVLGRPGRYSPVGHLLPLDLQWYEVGKRRRDVGVPRYAYSQFVAGPIDFERPIWTTAYDLYNWKVNATPELASLHPFVVERPEGQPVMVYFIGGESAAFSRIFAARSARSATSSSGIAS